MSFTLLEIKTQIESELDLEDEDFIDSTEFTSYVNEAIRQAEAEIHKLGLEDLYFRDSAYLALTTSDGTYALPTDIYADKILNIIYDTSEKMYEIKRIRGTRALERFHFLRRHGNSTTPYEYLLSNDVTNGKLIELAPVAQETSSTNVTIWYIRTAKELSANADVCDIPFIDFVLQYVRDKCINKERFTLDAPESPALMRQRQLMIDTLSEQVPDGNNIMEMDTSHYDDSV